MDDRFEQPVSILLGAGFVHTVDDVEDAYRILCEWDGRCGQAHAAAINACKAAFAGEVEPETARGIFEAFARAHGIYVPDAIIVNSVPGSRQELSKR